uniref:NADH-ubiquinone oxidoreductase chain 6 n=1 Tax=Neoephemera projecta TaxID=2770074 RepID=A0A8K1R9B0_9INSE|nr:NADH dehydrogenase subunit 6 [Neoephemera projecta]
MLLYLFIGLITIVGFIFCFMNHPLAMGLILLTQTVLISIASGLMAPSFWFSYILFLVFLGGMLVLFIYIISLASNEMFYYHHNLIFITLLLFMLMLLMLIMIDPIMINTFTNTVMSTNNFSMESSIWPFLLKLYNNSTYIMIMMLILYLFLTLIAVVNITQLYEGPLRTFN